MSLLAIPLILWNLSYFLAPPKLVAPLFLLGVAPGFGIGISLLLRQQDASSIVFFSVVNALVGLSLLGGVVSVVPFLSYTPLVFVLGLDLLYLAMLIAAWKREPPELHGWPHRYLTVPSLIFAVLMGSIIALGVLAFQIKASTGHSLPNALLYLWLLGAFLVLFSSPSTQSHRHVLFLVTAGLLVTWSQALSTNGLFAIDGISTVRLSRALVSGIQTDFASERLFSNLTTVGTLPALAILTRLPVDLIAKYVIPGVAGISLVGIYKLTTRWLAQRWAFASAFLLSYHFPFYVELTTLYRSALAFPVLIGLYIAMTAEDRRFRLGGVAYAISLPLLHDTVGVFLLGVLGASMAVAFFRMGIDDGPMIRRSASRIFRYGGISALSFYLVYLGTPTFETFASKVAAVLGSLSGRGFAGGSRRTLTATIGSLNETIIETLQQTTIVIEIGLMAGMTALVVLGWVFRGRVLSAAPRFEKSPVFGFLVVGNAAWFGVLVIQPVLGLPRVFLYAAPLLLGLFTSAFTHIGFFTDELRSHRSPAHGLPEGAKVAHVALVLVVIFGFLTQSGLVAFALGGHLSQPALGDAEDLRLRYYHRSDMAGNGWVTEVVQGRDRLYGDRFVEPLLLDDPELRHDTLKRITSEVKLATLLDRGCVFLRAVNGRTGRLLVFVGSRTTAVKPYPDEWLRGESLLYHAGGTRVVC